MLQNDVVGRYASAPDLQALAADPTARRAPQPISPLATPAKAPPPGSETSLSHSQAGPGASPSASWKGTTSGSNVSHAAQPTLGLPVEAQAVNKADQKYVQKVILKHERATALQRQGHRYVKMLARNWMFLLFAVLNAAGIWFMSGSLSSLKSQ